jgi:hypothetical protein
MDKVKKFLENYVQWLALALGVAFLGYVGYYYIMLKPVAVATVGPQSNVSPDEVDKLVADGPMKQLQDAINNKTPVQITEISPDYVDTHALAPFAAAPSDKVFATPWVPINIPQAPETVTASAVTGPTKVMVEKLPEVPALTNLQLSGGHSNVPFTAAPGTVQPVGNQAVDKNWETVEGTIPVAALAKAFDDAKIPPNFRPVAILRVQLFREEKNTDGTWSAPTEIAPLEINPLKEMPGANALVADQNDYKTWAESNVPLICQPPFYQVLQGDVWYEPGTPNPNQQNLAVIDDGFDPRNPGAFKGDPNNLTPAHRELYEAWLAKQAARDAARNRNQNNGTPNPGAPNFSPDGGIPGAPGSGGSGGTGTGKSGRGGGRSRGLAADPQRGGLDPMIPPNADGGPPGSRGYPGGPGMGMPGGPQSGAANTTAAQATLPAGSFDPSQPQVPTQGAPAGSPQDIRVWAHDPTAVSGHTYRYMMKYIISNPVAHTSNLCKPPELSQQFAIVSKDSEWTDPVSVESDTSFYALEVKGHGIHFGIFKWKNGVWQMQDFTAGPGDMVGTPDTAGTKTDFTTGWTLVDIRDDPRDSDNKIIVLVSDTGSVKKKDLNFDTRSARYHELLDEVSKNKAAVGGGAPGTPNM